MTSEDQTFIVQRNIKRFHQLLALEEDQEKRVTLGKLLREERAKQDVGALQEGT